MIAHLRGTLLEVQASRIIVEAGGVGYEVQVPATMVGQLPAEGQEVALPIRHVIREDGQFLYGFPDRQARALFDLLTDVKGCGPKTSLAILSDLGSGTVIPALISGDAKTLCGATGVGPRLAERLIVELRDKVAQFGVVVDLPVGATSSAKVNPRLSPAQRDLVEALTGLGYRRAEAEEVSAQIDTEQTPQEQIVAALRLLQK